MLEKLSTDLMGMVNHKQALVAHGLKGAWSGGFDRCRQALLEHDFGFIATSSRRLFAHPRSERFLGFPSGPRGFGSRVVDTSSLQTLDTLGCQP